MCRTRVLGYKYKNCSLLSTFWHLLLIRIQQVHHILYMFLSMILAPLSCRKAAVCAGKEDFIPLTEDLEN
jgi:hypothetical protein